MNGITISRRLDSVAKAQERLGITQYKLLEKAMGSDNPNDIIKARIVLRDIEERKGMDRKSYVIDPFEFQNSFGYKDRRINLSYGMLASMAKTPIINAIIRTRISQIAKFTEPQKDRFSIGYKIRKRQLPGVEDLDQFTPEEEKEIYRLTEFIENCGDSNEWGADDFDTFMRKIIRDSLRYDQSTFEVVRDRGGVPRAFYAVDAATIRIADSYDDEEYAKYKIKSKQIKGYYPSYVQIYQSKIYGHFYPWELCFGVRNPATDIGYNGYGFSELEELITIVTSMLWGDEYNRRFFKQGSAPKGLLRVSGNFNDAKIAEFRQQWNSTMRGVFNAHKTPILESDKAEWIDLQKSNRDMEFSNWSEYLIKLASAIYLIDPAEINFPLKGGAKEQTMFEGSNESRLKHSKDSGLYPLLKFAQKRIDKYIIKPLNPKFEFVFMGLDAKTPKEELELDEKAVKIDTTVNELRQKKGQDPIDGGDIILDPNFTQTQMMAAQEALVGEEEVPEEETPEFMEETTKAETVFEKAFNDYIVELNQR